MKSFFKEKWIILSIILISFLFMVGFVMAYPTMSTIINIKVINISDDYYLDILSQGLDVNAANTEVASQNGIMLTSSNIYEYNEDGWLAFGLRDSDIRAEFYSPDSHEHQFVFYGDHPRKFKIILENNAGELTVSEQLRFNGHISYYTYDYASNELEFSDSKRSETPFAFFIMQYMLLLMALFVASFVIVVIGRILFKMKPMKKLLLKELLLLPIVNLCVLWLLFYTGVPTVVAILPMFIISGVVRVSLHISDFNKRNLLMYTLAQTFTGMAIYAILMISL